jgi:large subunit ribosomal protein L18
MRSSKVKFNIRRERKRVKISKVSDRPRLSIFKSNRHIYAQITDKFGKVLASCSTLQMRSEISEINKSYCNKIYAEKIGKEIAIVASEKGLSKIVFDSSGYKYHGVLKVIADCAREKLDF